MYNKHVPEINICTGDERTETDSPYAASSEGEAEIDIDDESISFPATETVPVNDTASGSYRSSLTTSASDSEGHESVRERETTTEEEQEVGQQTEESDEDKPETARRMGGDKPEVEEEHKMGTVDVDAIVNRYITRGNSNKDVPSDATAAPTPVPEPEQEPEPQRDPTPVQEEPTPAINGTEHEREEVITSAERQNTRYAQVTDSPFVSMVNIDKWMNGDELELEDKPITASTSSLHTQQESPNKSPKKKGPTMEEHLNWLHHRADQRQEMRRVCLQQQVQL